MIGFLPFYHIKRQKEKMRRFIYFITINLQKMDKENKRKRESALYIE